MKNYNFYSFFLLVFFSSCATKDLQIIDVKENLSNPPLTIAFGSCSDQDKPQKLWDDILAEQPDVWIWLGDNIYGDSKDMAVLDQKYTKQKSHPLYQELIKNTKVIGTWDDHDYGANDAGKEYPMKVQSQQLLLDFLDVPKNAPVRKRAGVYDSYTIDHQLAKVKVILLDTRYFRDRLVKKGNGNAPNLDGEILGAKQWEWLEKELSNSKADVHIIASGIQVIPAEHRFEKWANFPNDRKKLFNLMVKYQVKLPIFISGDRHMGEISKLDWKGKTLYDITSSSLTHGWSNPREEANQYRVGSMVYTENYGLITISQKEGAKVEGFLKSDNQAMEVRLELQ